MSRRTGNQVAKGIMAARQAAQWSAQQRLETTERKFADGQWVRLKNGKVTTVLRRGHIGYLLAGMSGEFPASALEPADPP